VAGSPELFDMDGLFSLKEDTRVTERLGNNNVRVLLRSIAVFASITLAGACLAFILAGQAQAQTPDVEFA